MSGPDDPLGRRSLFSAPDEHASASSAAPDDGAPGPRPVRRPTREDIRPVSRATAEGAGTREGAGAGQVSGHRALFSAPRVSGRSVVVTCRTCRARTPLSFADAIRRLVPSVWLPLRPWSRWMRCPSCGTFSWCRVQWSHLISGR